MYNYKKDFGVKKNYKKWMVGLLVAFLVMAFVMPIRKASAASCEGVQTSIIECGDDQSGIGYILSLVINIATVGIGILAAIGIGVSGVQYLTAGGNEEKTRKAKRRILEVVIGLMAYVMLYALLQWLLPGGSLNPVDIEHYEAPESSSDSGGNSGDSGGRTPAAKECDTAHEEWVDVNVGTIRGYYINIPQGADETTPIMIYLHGCGEAYAGAKSALYGLKSVKSMLNSSQFISVIPHSVKTGSCGTEWSANVVKNMIEGAGEVGKKIGEKLASCNGTSNRKKYIMGMSDGALGTWNTVIANPGLFEAAAPVAGGGYNLDGSKFSHTRIVGVVGSSDPRLYNMKVGITTIKNSNPTMSPMLVIYGGKDHDNITASIDYNALFNCLLRKNGCSNFGSGTTIFYGD